MIKYLAMMLVILLAMPFPAFSEQQVDEYTWLDALTQEQLTALDNEIHKRLSANPDEQIESDEAADDAAGADLLVGQWVRKSEYFSGHDEIETYAMEADGNGRYTAMDVTDDKEIVSKNLEYTFEENGNASGCIGSVQIITFGLNMHISNYDIYRDETGLYLTQYRDGDRIYKVE